MLIAFIAAHLVASGRTEIKIAANLAANAVTEAAADGAVYQAMFRLGDPRPEGGWPLDGTARELAIGECRVTVRLFDEAARINPNLASAALLEALLRVAGSDAASARQLAAAIEDWVGGPATPRGTDEMLARYGAAGLDYAPPGEPIEALDELQRVLGMTQGVFAAIRPHLSLFAPAQPLLAQADPVVIAAMTQIGAVQPNPIPRQLSVVAARIEALAQGPNNARAARTAVVRVAPITRNVAVLSWSGDID